MKIFLEYFIMQLGSIKAYSLYFNMYILGTTFLLPCLSRYFLVRVIGFKNGVTNVGCLKFRVSVSVKI